jgi:hypothetical protein
MSEIESGAEQPVPGSVKPAKHRSRNGLGYTQAFSVQFDVTDPAEKRAFETAQRLASPHGRRKDLLVLFLNALADYEEQTGKAPHADMIGAHLIALALAGRLGQAALPPEVADATPVEIAVTSSGKASAEQQASRFARSFAARFRPGGG